MYMVFCVLDDSAALGKVLEALNNGGISGATILESSGLHRQQKKHVALRYAYSAPFTDETDNTSIFIIVPDRKAAEDCLSIVEGVVGDMMNPDTGVFAAWELDLVKGPKFCDNQEP